MQQNLEAVLQVMRFIYDNIIYAELNTKRDYCPVSYTHLDVYKRQVQLREKPAEGLTVGGGDGPLEPPAFAAAGGQRHIFFDPDVYKRQRWYSSRCSSTWRCGCSA